MANSHSDKWFCGSALLLCFMVMVQKASAREFLVGGSSGWRVPADNNSESYGQWAEKNRFQIGDSVVFVYPPNQDSVLQVTGDAYANCNTDAPIKKFTDGHTSIKLEQSGPHYFISGNKDNCKKNEKLVIIVMANRSNRSSATNQATPPSSAPPMGSKSPVGAPSPSPMPTTDSIPSPAPTPNPSEEPHQPPSAASPVFINLLGSAATVVYSALFML